MLEELLFLFKLAFFGNNLSLIFISIFFAAVIDRGGLLFKAVALAFLCDYVWGFMSMRLDGHHLNIIFSAFLGSIININDNLIYYFCRFAAFFILIQLFLMVRIAILPDSIKKTLAPALIFERNNKKAELENAERRLQRIETLMYKNGNYK